MEKKGKPTMGQSPAKKAREEKEGEERKEKARLIHLNEKRGDDEEKKS